MLLLFSVYGEGKRRGVKGPVQGTKRGQGGQGSFEPRSVGLRGTPLTSLLLCSMENPASPVLENTEQKLGACVYLTTVLNGVEACMAVTAGIIKGSPGREEAVQPLPSLQAGGGEGSGGWKETGLRFNSTHVY